MKLALATIDTRYPVTAALRYACDAGLVDPDQRQALIVELIDMVIEAAKKFADFKKFESVRKALDISLGILSLALVHSTRGLWDPERWAKTILEKGMMSIISEVVSLVKFVSDVTPMAEIVPATDEVPPDAARKMLIELSQSRNEKFGNVWNGYERLQHRLELKEGHRITTELSHWLIRELAQQPLGTWLAMNSEETGDHKMRPPFADNVINNLLFRHCVGLPTKGPCILRNAHFAQIFKAFDADRKGWKRHVRGRYDALRARIPANLRSGLLYRENDWYDRILAKGPPAPATKGSTLQDPNGRFRHYHIHPFL